MKNHQVSQGKSSKFKKVGSNRVDNVSQSQDLKMLSSFNASNHSAATLGICLSIALYNSNMVRFMKIF